MAAKTKSKKSKSKASKTTKPAKTINIIRSKKNGCFKVAESTAWGKYLLPAEDPEGQDLTKEELEGIKLIDNFPKVPANLWVRFVKLAFHFCNDERTKDLEVSIVLLRNAIDLTRWKIIVPSQEVSGASVDAKFEKSCDIETGEEYTQFPPEGWLHAGSAHSHNSMAAFFSHTDDENELGVPGMHIVIGKLDQEKNNYEYSASVVLQRQRKMVDDIDSVVEDALPDVTFNPNVLNYVKVKEFKFEDSPWARFFPRKKSVLDDIDNSLTGNFDLDLDKDSCDEDAMLELLEQIPDTDDPDELVAAWFERVIEGSDEIPEPTDKELNNIVERGEDK